MTPWVNKHFVACGSLEKMQRIEKKTACFRTCRTQPAKVTILSYYGGAKGQSLKITETKDGKVMMAIIPTPKNSTVAPTTTTTTTEFSGYEFPPLPSRHESEYDTNLRKVHETASNILKLQETAKKQGKLTNEEQMAYNENINALNLSAQNLARYEEYDDSFENDDKADLSSWLDKRKNNKKDVNKKKEQINKNKEPNEKEEEFKEEENKEDEETVGVDLPPDDASVAEAKPVGLAVAGEGGVAASKPIATAVVGPKGLAVARPVGTAIAGVSPDQALVPIYAEGYLAAKPGRGGDKKNATASELLNRIINKYHQH